MGNNYIIDGSFQLIRTNPLLTTNLQIVVASNYNLYLESINSHKFLNDDIYKHFSMTKNTYLEDKIPEFYNNLPINIAFCVKYDDDKDLVYTDYQQQFDSIYWSGASKIKENIFYKEEFEYFAPLYIDPNNIPDSFIIMRVDDPAIYELFENDLTISNTTKNNFKSEIIDKWKCISMFDMSKTTDFGYWIDNNYTSNDRFPIAPLEFDSKKYNFTRWYGIDYNTGVYTNKQLFMEDKLWYENPHFKLEEFITENYKNNELIFPNIANFKFLFDDTPASPFEFKKYTLNRYFGFYVDLDLVKTITPYIGTPLIDNLKIENNIFMSTSQTTGSTMPFDILTWNDNKIYYIFAFDDLYKVVKINENGYYYYKIISDKNINISDIHRDNEIDIVFNDLGYYDYNNCIKPRTTLSLSFDRLIQKDGVTDLYADLYLINIDNNYHVLDKKINEYTGLMEYFIRTDYGIECNSNTLLYWLQDRNSEYSKTINVEDDINNEKPMMFKVYRVKFRDIKDFDFNRIDTGFANFDFEKKTEYVETSEHKLYAAELRDASETTIFKKYENNDLNYGKIINTSSEYISTDELFEINKIGLNNVWDKNPNIVKWGYKNSNSHSDYPYKLNNNNKVGSLYNKTTDVFSKFPDVLSKTHDYFYRIGNFYKSTINNDNTVLCDIQYYDNQTLSIETNLFDNNYFDLDKYIDCDFDYFDYFFKNNQNIDIDNYNQTSHYSILNNGNGETPSSTLFKGIKYNIYKIKNLIRDNEISLQNSKIVQTINDNTQNYNGYKFSIILNSIYPNLTENTLVYNIPKRSVYSYNNLLTDGTGLHIFVNDKYKNILIIINSVFTSTDDKILTLNDISHFDQREGLYLNKTISGTTAYSDYDPNMLVAYNFISSINNLNSKNLFSDYPYFYYIGENNDSNRLDFGYTKINDSSNNTLRKVSYWNNDFPPLNIVCELPDKINIKKNSFTTKAIKGPKFNIYDKFKTDFNELIYDKSFIKEPLSSYIVMNEAEIKPIPTVSKELIYSNSIYRYNGYYEPIFKTVELFKPIDYSIIQGGFFTQKKCGGYYNDKYSIDSSDIILKKSIIKTEVNNLYKNINYLNNEINYINDKILAANIINDYDILSKLNIEKTYYTNLLSANTIEYEKQTIILDNQNIPQTPVENKWLFKDKLFGLCDGNFAYCDLEIKNDNTTDSDTLNINNFNFSIPLDSIITGIGLNINKKAQINDNDYGLITDTVVTFTKPDGTLSINNYNINPWSTGSTNITYGGDGNLWGFTGDTLLTPQDINNNKFEANIKVKANKTGLTGTIINIAYIDCVCITIYYTINGIETGNTYISNIERNTVFDTGLNEFGEISELMYSKVNEHVNPLKIQGTEEDKSIYPKIDEFGYSWDKRFIFKSSWDNDYYIRTKNEIDE